MKLNKNDKSKVGIYCIMNTVNNKKYIGKSIDIHRRMQDHVSKLRAKSKDENRHLINSWHKHGESNFIYFVVEVTSKEMLSERELFWMMQFKCLDRDKGYNLRLDSSSGMEVSQETRDKLSVSQSKRWECEQARIENGKRTSEFWANNPKKKEEMAKKVKQSQSKYFFTQYNIEGELLSTYQSMDEIIEKNPTFTRSSIYNVCNGYKPHYKKYVFKKHLKI